MKKVFMSLAIVAAMAAAVACSCNNEKKAESCCEEAKECCEEAKECCDSTKCAGCDHKACCDSTATCDTVCCE